MLQWKHWVRLCEHVPVHGKAGLLEARGKLVEGAGLAAAGPAGEHNRVHGVLGCADVGERDTRRD